MLGGVVLGLVPHHGLQKVLEGSALILLMPPFFQIAGTVGTVRVIWCQIGVYNSFYKSTYSAIIFVALTSDSMVRVKN